MRKATILEAVTAVIWALASTACDDLPRWDHDGVDDDGADDDSSEPGGDTEGIHTEGETTSGDGHDDGFDDGSDHGDVGGEGAPMVKKVFKAHLSPVNDSGVTGIAVLTIEDDRITAIVRADGLAQEIVHAQHVHTGSMCPGTEADTNGDGYIDQVEAVAAGGPILVPLDNDLGAQLTGSFPMADAMGRLDYVAGALLADMLADLRAEDPDPDDAIVKLGAGDDLALERRIVEIHGVDPSTELPDSVASLGEAPATATLPVACGSLVLPET